MYCTASQLNLLCGDIRQGCNIKTMCCKYQHAIASPSNGQTNDFLFLCFFVLPCIWYLQRCSWLLKVCCTAFISAVLLFGQPGAGDEGTRLMMTKRGCRLYILYWSSLTSFLHCRAVIRRELSRCSNVEIFRYKIPPLVFYSD